MMKIKEFVCVVIAITMFLGLAGFAGNIEHNYTRKDCEVISVKNGVVKAEDVCGYVWEFEGAGFYIGEIITLKMHTNYTHGTITDDYVTGVKN
jgi:hypothetical protein